MDSLPDWLSQNELYIAPDIDKRDGRSDNEHKQIEDRTLTKDISQANVIGSRFSPYPHELHKIFLDIDVPHHYQQSKTPGHGHLMLNVNVTRSELVLLHEFLVALGITGKGNQAQITDYEQNFLRINSSSAPPDSKIDYGEPF